jgi:DNA polymerase III subunit gamma/tau
MSPEKYNNEYLVTARKWRPLLFSEVIGQEHVTKTLQNAIKNNKIHHAYLFSGPRGIGKTTTARIYARAVNCESPQDAEPCNKCDSCKAILDGRSIDVIEIDGASNNSVDDIRKLRENAKYPPVNGRYKIYIIDEVHMLSTSAFNALLKTLEEPPPHLLFVFATTEPHKVIPTILSRCQRFDFRRIDIEQIIYQLKKISENEKIQIEEKSLLAIAKKADGSMRDAQSTFDQAVAFCGTNIKYSDIADYFHLIDTAFFFRISTSINEKDINNIFNIAKEVTNRGYDIRECLSGMLEHFRNLLTIKVTEKTDLIEASESIKEKYKKESIKFTKSDILRMMNLIADAEQSQKYTPQPLIRFELLLVKLALMDSTMEISALLSELKELKKKILSKSKDSNYHNHPKNQQLNSIEISVNKTREVIETENKKTKDNSPEHLMEKWNDFLAAYATSKYGLFVLSQQNMVEPKFLKGEIILQCKEKFIYDNINYKSIDLKEYLLSFYKTPVNLKLVISRPAIENTDKGNQQKTVKTKKDKETEIETSFKVSGETNRDDLTPIEEALINMFDAKLLKVTRNSGID